MKSSKNWKKSTTEFKKALKEFVDDVPSVDTMKEPSFFVYYNNDNGNILCISPILDDSQSETAYVVMPYAQIKHFILGIDNPSMYILKIDDVDGGPKLVKKESNVEYLRSGRNNSLVKIPKSDNKSTDLHIDKVENGFEISVRQQFFNYLDSQMIDIGSIKTLQGNACVDVFIVLNDDPHNLYDTITLSISELLEFKKMFVKYEEDLGQDYSLYIKPIFRSYSYTEIT